MGYHRSNGVVVCDDLETYRMWLEAASGYQQEAIDAIIMNRMQDCMDAIMEEFVCLHS